MDLNDLGPVNTCFAPTTAMVADSAGTRHEPAATRSETSVSRS